MLRAVQAPSSRAVLFALGAALSLACSSGGEGSDGSASTPEAAIAARAAPTLPGPTPAGPEEAPDTSVETCSACHGATGSHPVGDIRAEGDAHAVDDDPAGPLTPSGLRRLDATLTRVDLTGSSVVIDFSAVDEEGQPFDLLDPSDGRFAIVRLDAGTDGDPSEWVGIGDASTERFTSGVFAALSGGQYRYTSAYDPTGRVVDGDPLRVAIQLSASDLPAENAWCEFDADLLAPNLCGGGASRTRDIVQTEDCNVCHGPTSETRLSFHGGGRTDVEYCVTCHNPSGNTDMTLLTHKIHAGATLTEGFRSYSEVVFTKDLDDCSTCHTGGGADVDNWKTVPSQTACGSCHDDVDFATGQNHGSGGVQPDNRFCSGCHPADGPVTPIQLPIETVHRGPARAAEAATYRGPGNGFAIESVVYDEESDQIEVVYAVVRNGSRMNLASAPQWTAGGRLSLQLGWETSDYRNTGSGETPAQPLPLDALDIGGTVSDLGQARYQALLSPPSGASDTVTVHLEGRPVADLDGDFVFSDRIPVASVFADVNIEGGRAIDTPRRQVVDAARCNVCHDSGGAGLAFHGTNRVHEMIVCAVCHNGDATDLARRPADPTTTPDGKREEAIDWKRMIHQIHAGAALENGLVVYGFGGAPRDYGSVDFLGNLANCETCHPPGTYSTEQARAANATTIDTGVDVATPVDDLNISPTASVCASCHDQGPARAHMLDHGASFEVLDENLR